MYSSLTYCELKTHLGSQTLKSSVTRVNFYKGMDILQAMMNFGEIGKIVQMGMLLMDF